MTKHKMRLIPPLLVRLSVISHSGFVIFRHSGFVIRHWGVYTAVLLFLSSALCHAQSAIPGPSVQPGWEKLPDGSVGRVADFRGVGDLAIPAYIRKPKGSGAFPVVVMLHGGKYSKEATFGLGRSSKSPVQDFINAGWESGKNEPPKTLDIYFIDVGRGVGNATLLVAPSGESMLLDAGPSYSALNVLEVMNKAGLKKLDYLVTTHYHADHFGATAELAKQIPILHYVDHGPSIEFGKSDDWWKERRGPWFKAGMGERYDTLYKSYLKVRQEGRHLVVKAGDVMPIKGTEVRVLCAAGKLLADPLAGAGDKNPACADVDKRSEDDAEDAQSIGVLVTRGAFRFVYLADLTWNKANDLFCPLNKVGSVDAYLITHHAQSFPKAMGDYYHGLSACPKSEVHGLRPRVAILSLGAMGHKQGDSAAIETVHKSPGLEDLWQTQFIEAGGEKNHNSPKQFIANIGGKNAEARYLKLSANADGSFTMLNSRNGFSKHYPVRKKDLGR
jgi:competence protein ComEC